MKPKRLQPARMLPRLGVALALLGATPCHGECYSIDVIQGPTCPPFGDHTPTFVSGLSQDGVVVGHYWQCVIQSRNEGFIWTAQDGLFTIPRPAGVVTLNATDVNNSRQVTVSMTIPGLGMGSLAWMYDKGRFAFLGLPAGGNYSEATAINSGGNVVGVWGNNLVGDPGMHAFFSQDGVMEDIGAQLAGASNSARDINDHQTIVGAMGMSSPVPTPRAFVWKSGRVTDLGPIPDGTTSTANGVNVFDHVVGTGLMPPASSAADRRAFRWINGTWTMLPILSGAIGNSAFDINDDGQIVGSSVFTVSGTSRGCIWLDGIVHDLNDLVVTDLSITITSAIAINRAGQIACGGQYQGHSTGFLLAPLPPKPADLSGDCRVGPADLMLLLGSWGPVTERTPTPAADIDKNKIINGIDLAILLGAWG